MPAIAAADIPFMPLVDDEVALGVADVEPEVDPLEDPLPGEAIPLMPAMDLPAAAAVAVAATGYVALRSSAASTPAATPAVASGFSRAMAAIGLESEARTGSAVGRSASASSTISGPQLGSVPLPVKMPPKAIPVTQ